MRIVVLSYGLHGGGGLSVGKNIVSMLPKVGPKHTYMILVPKGAGYEKHKEQKNVTVNEIPRMSFIRRVRFDLFCLPKLVKKINPDIVWSLGSFGLQKPPCKQAVIFQQPHLIYESSYHGKIPFFERIKIVVLIKRVLARSLKHTDLVFCQTPVARERFSRTFRYPIDQIKVMPNAVSEFAKTDRQNAGIPEVFKKDGYFNLFFLTRFYAHKNLEVLIEIFRKYSEKLNDVRCIVTVAKEQHPNAAKFLSSIHKYKLQDHIINIGPLKQEKLAGFFYNSDALLFPTLMESFSATYLEAMHFNLPILTSDLDFARDVCGDAALYFDPWNPTDIIDKILALKNDAGLQQKLICKGRQRISSFFRSWQDVTAEAVKQLELLGDYN